MSGPLDRLFPYSAETRGLVVRVSVSFLPEQSDPAHERWFWSYHIRIENCGPYEAQLLSRRWVITDGRGERQLVEGEGVVGAQPVIGAGECYDYVSGCPLDTPLGAMEGVYIMVDAMGMSFEARIPRFQLTGPAVTR